MRIKVDLFSVAGILILLFFTAQVALGWSGNTGNDADAPSGGVAAAALPLPAEVAVAQPVAPPAADDSTFVPPYETYWLTQGPHGQSYGHLAIDIAAGHGTTILSPIHGAVAARWVDEWGNTIILIENSRYAVTMYHGDYWPAVGEAVAAGQAIGTESNHGYTMDMAGNLCAGRDCGYHTHLNVFDKAIGANINPLTLMPASR